MFLKNRNISSKIKSSKVTEYAALKYSVKLSSVCVLLLSVCADLLQVPGFTELAYV